MVKYVEIYINKKNKSQWLVLCSPDHCTATIDYELSLRGIEFTQHKFVGRLYSKNTEESYRLETFAYAKNYEWMPTVDLTKGTENV